MPMGTAPPDPWKEPEAYRDWLFDELELRAREGDMVGVIKLLEEQRAFIVQSNPDA